MAEPEDINERIELLRAGLSPEGIALLEEFKHAQEAMRHGEYTEEDKAIAQARLIQQLNTLSRHDYETVVEVMRLQALGHFDPEGMLEKASRDPESARRVVAWAQHLETVVEGRPLRESMDVREAVEVLKRHLSGPGV